MKLLCLVIRFSDKFVDSSKLDYGVATVMMSIVRIADGVVMSSLSGI